MTTKNYEYFQTGSQYAQLFISNTPICKHYHPHFTDEDIQDQRRKENSLLKVTEPGVRTRSI